MKKQIVNALIPDAWVTKAVAARLTGQEERKDLRRMDCVSIACQREKCVMGDGVFAPQQLTPDVISHLRRSGWIWIHLTGDKTLKENQAWMESLMVSASIPFTKARVRVRKDQPNSRTRKIDYGIVVDITDACEAILLLKPNLLEERRAARYNRDDPKL